MPPALPDATALSLLLIALVLDAAIAWIPGLREFLRAPADTVGGLAMWLDRRLNRERRSAGTRLARGAIVVLAIAGLAWGAGVLLHDFARDPHGARGVEVAALLFLVFQRQPFDLARRAARTMAAGDHGAARAAIEQLASAYGAGVVGVTFWYLLFGLPGLCVYRAVQVVSARIGGRGAFGRGAQLVNAALGAIPAIVAGVLLSIAALFVPHANPVRALRTLRRDFDKAATPDAGFPQAAMAGAFGLALGGGPWIGDGRARATAQDVRNAAYLYAVACLIHAGGVALALAAYSPI